MTSFVVVGHLTTTGSDQREKVLFQSIFMTCFPVTYRAQVIEALTKVMRYSQQEEPEVLKYVINIPRDEEDTKSIFVIEEYAQTFPDWFNTVALISYRYLDTAAMDNHMATPAVQELIKSLSSEPLLEGAPRVQTMKAACTFSTKRANNQVDPYIVYGKISYQPGVALQTIPYWQAVCDTAQTTEQGCSVWGLYTMDDVPDELYTLEVYESYNYLWDVHVKSAAVQANVANTKDLRTGLHHTLLRFRQGFWHR